MDDAVGLDPAEHGGGGARFEQVEVAAAQTDQFGLGKRFAQARHDVVPQKARAARHEDTLERRAVFRGGFRIQVHEWKTIISQLGER